MERSPGVQKSGGPGVRGLVLAAGRGSRFQSESGEAFPKVLRPLLGKPLVSYVIDALREAGVDDITLVVGFQAELVRREIGSGVGYATQEEQKGSGHAVACARDAFEGFSGSVVIMCGDSPLFTSDTIRGIVREHTESGSVITLAAARLDDPTGYGRIVRDKSGQVIAIIEEKCAGAEERSIKEVNGGVYCFDADWLFSNIALMAVNEAGEYNLTDMVRVAIAQGRKVSAVPCDPQELLGVNTPGQLKVVEEIVRGR
ncbi:MAG: sugar phosphate nucleotidyltransferase [Armatimonadota bacterium]|nr:NTP transferase domain-containing protein [bacterium]